MSHYPQRIAANINIVLLYILWTLLKLCSFSALGEKKTQCVYSYCQIFLYDSLDNNNGEVLLKKNLFIFYFHCMFQIFIDTSIIPSIYWIFMFSGIQTVFGWFMLKDPYTLSWRVMKAATTAVILFSLSSLVCTCNYVGLSLKRSYKRDIDLKLYVCVCVGGGERMQRLSR